MYECIFMSYCVQNELPKKKESKSILEEIYNTGGVKKSL